VAEAWEAPDKGALRLLRSLRAALGPGRRVLVLLARTGAEGHRGPAAQDVALWRESLARLEDPWLAVEGIGPAPGAVEERA
jgi:hypothetical protein